MALGWNAVLESMFELIFFLRRAAAFTSRFVQRRPRAVPRVAVLVHLALGDGRQAARDLLIGCQAHPAPCRRC
jgi:hypothetical protein